jgi:hypothetical protein
MTVTPDQGRMSATHPPAPMPVIVTLPPGTIVCPRCGLHYATPGSRRPPPCAHMTPYTT